MTLAYDSAATAQLNTPARGIVWLVDLEFLTGTVYYTTHAIDIPANGHTYTGYGSLVDVSPPTESENGADEKVLLGLSIVNTALIAACMGNVENYRGRRVRLYSQVIGPTFQKAGEPTLYWQGYMEPVKIDRKTSDNGPSTGRIELPCRRAGMARARNADGLRLSDAQQQAEYPGDRFYEYVQTLHEQGTNWLSVAFQAWGV